MQDYYWDLNYIKDKFKDLKELYKIEKDDRKKEIIYNDLMLLQENFFYNNKNNSWKILNYYKAQRDEVDGLKETHFPRYHFSDFVNNSRKIIEAELPDDKSIYFSEENILDVTNEFYKYFDKEYYKYFLMNYKDRHDHLTFEQHSGNKELGFSFELRTFNETFIKILKKDTIDDIYTTIHEYMHTISYRINDKRLRNYFYAEIESIFMEFAANDYLKKYFDRDIIANREYQYLHLYSCNALSTCCMLMLRSDEKKLGRDFKNFEEIQTAAQENSIPDDYLSSIITNSLFLDHTISYIIAIELYYLYKKDKEKAIYLLTTIIKRNNHDFRSLNKLLDGYGVHLNENSKKYSESLIRKRKKYNF